MTKNNHTGPSSFVDLMGDKNTGYLKLLDAVKQGTLEEVLSELSFDPADLEAKKEELEAQLLPEEVAEVEEIAEEVKTKKISLKIGVQRLIKAGLKITAGVTLLCLLSIENVQAQRQPFNATKVSSYLSGNDFIKRYQLANGDARQINAFNATLDRNTLSIPDSIPVPMYIRDVTSKGDSLIYGGRRGAYNNSYDYDDNASYTVRPLGAGNMTTAIIISNGTPSIPGGMSRMVANDLVSAIKSKSNTFVSDRNTDYNTMAADLRAKKTQCATLKEDLDSPLVKYNKKKTATLKQQIKDLESDIKVIESLKLYNFHLNCRMVVVDETKPVDKQVTSNNISTVDLSKMDPSIYDFGRTEVVVGPNNTVIEVKLHVRSSAHLTMEQEIDALLDSISHHRVSLSDPRDIAGAEAAIDGSNTALYQIKDGTKVIESKANLSNIKDNPYAHFGVVRTEGDLTKSNVNGQETLVFAPFVTMNPNKKRLVDALIYVVDILKSSASTRTKQSRINALITSTPGLDADDIFMLPNGTPVLMSNLASHSNISSLASNMRVDDIDDAEKIYRTVAQKNRKVQAGSNAQQGNNQNSNNNRNNNNNNRNNSGRNRNTIVANDSTMNALLLSLRGKNQTQRRAAITAARLNNVPYVENGQARGGFINFGRIDITYASVAYTIEKRNGAIVKINITYH